MRPLIPTTKPVLEEFLPVDSPETWWYWEQDVWSSHAFWKESLEENDQESTENWLEHWRFSESILGRLIDLGYNRLVSEEELYDERDLLHLYEREE